MLILNIFSTFKTVYSINPDERKDTIFLVKVDSSGRKILKRVQRLSNDRWYLLDEGQFMEKPPAKTYNYNIFGEDGKNNFLAPLIPKSVSIFGLTWC